MRYCGIVIGLMALVVLAMAPQAGATTGFSVGSDFDDQLYRVELETGARTAIGPVGFGDVEGLAFDASGVLFGFDDVTNQLLRIDTATGAGTAVGPSGLTITDVGLDFHCQTNPFLSVDAPEPFNLNRLDVATGAGTAIGPQGVRVTGLASDGQRLFGITGDNDNRTVVMDTATGAANPLGPTGIELSDGGIAAASDGTIWGVVDGGGAVFTLDKQTGAATVRANLGTSGFESLAIDAPSLCAPPTATIVSGPKGLTRQKSPSFGFSVSGQPIGMTVACGFDGLLGPCSSANSHTGGSLKDGGHIFVVQVTNRDGIQGGAERSFEIDSKAPQTIIKKVKVTEDDVKVKFRSNEKGSTFQCRVDRKKFRRCRSPKVFKNLDDGKHKIRVRATDKAGNVDRTPAKRKVNVDDE